MTRKILVPMDVHNAFKQCEEGMEGDRRNSDARVQRFLVPLFAELSKKRPTWSYICEGWGDMDPSGAFYLYGRFTIMEDGEDLGTVWASKNWRTGDFKYAFDNHRLQASRSRGRYTETKDLKKAVKLILANIYAKTLPELMDVARSISSSQASTAIYAPQRYHNHVRDKLLPNISAFVIDNFEAFASYNTYNLEDKHRFRDTYASAERARAAQGMLDAKRHALVVERGSKLYVEYAKDLGTIHTYSLSDLPDHLKQGVALLKLCEVGVLLDDVGIRTDNNTYVILNGEYHDQGTS
jgi:hypothetical protein